MLNCKQATELVSQSLDQRLPWSKRVQLKLHLMMCKYCMRFLKQMRAIQTIIKSSQESIESDASIKLSDSAKAELSERLKDL